MTDPVLTAEAFAVLETELLGGPRLHTRADVERLAEVDDETAQRLWRALGFPDVDEDNVAFTDRDVEALRTVTSLVRMGVVEEHTQLAVTRAMGQSLSRLAEWQVATITDVLAHNDQLAPDEATEAARVLVPVMEGLIGYVWRRHLAATAGRVLTSGQADAVMRHMTVGFADLVGFTSLTRQVDETRLERLVDTFEGLATDAIAEAGGRVVKTLGDEVMFTVDDPNVAADIALRIAEAVTSAEDVPDVRVGVAYGPALARLGDVYGEPVNLASRLTSIARPGSVLVDRELATVLEADERWRLRRLPPRPVRGYALLQAFRLRRAGDDTD